MTLAPSGPPWLITISGGRSPVRADGVGIRRRVEEARSAVRPPSVGNSIGSRDREVAAVDRDTHALSQHLDRTRGEVEPDH